jgi:XisH protein
MGDTDDPLKVGAGGAKFEIHLGAERIVAADRGEEKIAIIQRERLRQRD